MLVERMNEMNFDLSQEQAMLQKMIREFSDEVVAPGAVERDRTKALPLEVIKELSQMGITGLPYSAE